MLHVSLLVVWIISTVFAGDTPFSLHPFLELYTPLVTSNSECYTESLYFQNAAQNLTPWALQMLDASSKIPSSLLVGNIVDFGNFDECLAVRSDSGVATSKRVVGKYCSVKATFNRTTREVRTVTLGDLTKEWTLSVCIPATCTSDDLTQQLKYLLTKNSSVVSDIQTIFCKSSLDYTGLSVGSWIFIIFTLALFLLIFLATCVERRFIKISPHVRSVVLSFSLIKNGKMLLMKTQPGRIGSMNGIRAIASILVIAFHRSFFTKNSSSTNRYLMGDILKSNLVGPLMNTAGSEIFFLLSGILLARGFMAERKSEVPFSYAKYILHRYLRLTPSHLFTILIHMTVFYEMGSGPLWEDQVGVLKKNCLENWWFNMLYVNNYANKHSKMCISQSWYLAADMQLHIVAPLFLFVLYKKSWLGIVLTVITLLASCIYTFHTWLASLQRGDAEDEYAFFESFHRRTEHRISSFLIGILLGFFLERYKKEKIVISQLTRIVGWTVSVGVLITYIYLPLMRHLGWVNHPPTLQEEPYGPFFSAAVGWIIFVCDQGYGGTLNQFLSHHYFQILSRLSFAVYLTHKVFIFYDLGTRRTADFFSCFSNVQKLWFDITLSNLASVFLCLAVEYPCMNLVNLFFKKKK